MELERKSRLPRPGGRSRLMARPLGWAVLLIMGLAAYAGEPVISPQALENSALKRGSAPTRRGVPVEMKMGHEPTPRFTGPLPGIIAGATVERDETGVARRIYTQTEMDNAKTPREAANAYLLANREALGLSENLNELLPVREVESLTRHHITYQQVYSGLPVFGGRLSVHLDKKLAVQQVNADLIPISAPAPLARPQNPAGAIPAAIQAVGYPPSSPPQTEAGVLVQKGQPVAVWRITFETASPGADWEVMVDAAANNALSARNRACYVDGTGMVYDPDPVTTSGIASLPDNNNADSATLTAQRVSRTLRGLDGSGFLTGTYCRTAVSASESRAFSASFVFNYTRSQNQFDETNCYYHIDTIVRHIQSLGFNNIQNRQTVINVNTITADNSFYSPSTKQITMGSGGVDDAEDGHIIWHECGHAIHDNQVPGWGSTTEGGAMGEGFGDYWAASSSAGVGPNAPGWDVYVGKWDAVSYNPGNPGYLRRVDSTKHYPENIVNQVHADGEIWSATLWQIRGLFGRTRADKIILESHFSVPPSGRFADGANAILAANQALYAGQDQTALRQIFINRGILSVANAPSGLTASLSGNNVQLNWTDNSNNETGFSVERQTSGTGAFTEIGQTGANNTSYLDTNTASDTTYTYRVRATTPEGSSGASNTATITTPFQTFTIGGQVSGITGLSGISVQASGTGALRSSYSQSPGLNIPDNNTTGVTATLNVPDTGTLTAIRIGVNITHTWRGDLEVGLIAPDGTLVLLHNRTGGSADNLITSYPDQTAPAQSLSALNGKQVNGAWRLRVRDLAGADLGTLNSWNLTLSYSGAVNRAVTTGADGTFTLSDMPQGTYTLAPQSAGFTYAPANRSVTLGPNATAQNFAAFVSASGTLQLEDAVNPAQPVTFTFRPTASGSPFDRPVTLSSIGAFSLADIPAGEYTVRVKGAKWLAVAQPVSLGAGSMTGLTFALLRGGDANNDNSVDVLDLDLLIQAFDAMPDSPNWNPNSDFNCDNAVDVLDLDILIRNFDQTGEA